MMRSLLVLPQVFTGDDESLDLSRAFIDLKKEEIIVRIE